jgi:pyruvate/2-oxoglutarate dehydrogenase complex dihydrolipoamide acyltransferase (E2) component
MVDVRLIYDHRVLDGATVARVLTKLEQELNGAVLQELLTVAETARLAG